MKAALMPEEEVDNGELDEELEGYIKDIMEHFGCGRETARELVRRWRGTRQKMVHGEN